ncbi:hypothetical protein AB0H29_16700 [Streptomyces thermolilacinus]
MAAQDAGEWRRPGRSAPLVGGQRARGQREVGGRRAVLTMVGRAAAMSAAARGAARRYDGAS